MIITGAFYVTYVKYFYDSTEICYTDLIFLVFLHWPYGVTTNGGESVHQSVGPSGLHVQKSCVRTTVQSIANSRVLIWGHSQPIAR